MASRASAVAAVVAVFGARPSIVAGCVIAGTGVWYAAPSTQDIRYRWVAWLAGTATAAIGTLLLIRVQAPATAAGLVLAGLALALLDVAVPAQLLALALAAFAGSALLGHGYGAPVPMALAFLALAAGLLLARPDRPAIRPVLAGDLGGRAARRLAPAGAAIVALALVLGRRSGGLPGTVAAAMLVILLYLVPLGAAVGLARVDRRQRDLVASLTEQRDARQSVLDALPEAFAIIDPDERIRSVSARWPEITGVPPEQAIGLRPPYPWWPVEQLDRRHLALSIALSANEPRSTEGTFRRPDGSIVEMRLTATPVRDPDGRLLMLVVAYRDVTERNTVRRQRRVMAEQLDHFFALSTELMGIVGVDGYLRRANPAWQRVLGYDPDELVGRPYLELVHPDDRAQAMTNAAAVTERRTVGELPEVRFRTRDGRYRWLNWSATLGPEGDVIYGIARDVTAQREAEDARKKLAAIVDSTYDAIIGKTLDGTITSWNPSAQRMYGYSAEQAIGRSIHMIVPAEDHAAVDATLARVGRGEVVKDHDAVRVARDGTTVNASVTVSPIWDINGTVVGAASITRDMSDRRRAEERFRRLVLNAPDAMVIVDESGAIRLANEQTERLFGYQAAELIGQPVELLVPAALRDRHVLHRRSYTQDPHVRGMRAVMELSGLRRDGTRFPAEISLAPLDTEEGLLVSAAVRDITERKQVEQALATARDEALAAARLKSQFVAMVSHEIRTPMNGVIGLVRLLLLTNLAPDQRRYAESIQSSARGLLTILNDILDFSKIEAGKVALAETDVDLGALVEEVVNATAGAAREKDLEITSYYPVGMVTAVRGDPVRIRQVLLNLTSNAVKFTAEGEIVLRVEPAADGAHGYTFSVSDTGIGVAEADLARLFEPFTQVDAGNTRQFGGTGLGLAISRQLVELMGGRLEVASELGRGSRFWFTITLPPQTEQPVRARAVRDGLAGRRLLIAVDNPSTRHLLAEHAESWGMTVARTPDGGSALAELRRAARERRSYDSAVVGQQLPDLGGVELAGRIAQDTTIPSPALILLTSGGYDEGRLRGYPGAVDALPRPVGPSALYNSLVRLLAPPVPAPVRSRPADRGRVLLAEDNDINQMVAVETLALLGYQTDVAHDGAEALDLASHRAYKAILMDCQMPTMDGYEATRQLRLREPAGRHTPIIAMTAGALIEDRQRCLDAGMDDYLAKPIDMEALRAVLERCP